MALHAAFEYDETVLFKYLNFLFVYSDRSIHFRVRQNVAAPGRNRSRNNNNNIGHQGGGNQQQRGTNRPRNQQPKRGGQQARGRSQKKIGLY